MLIWANTFLVLSIIAGIIGFSGFASGSLDFAKVLFAVFALLYLISLAAHFMTKREPPAD
ncbi:DUF1328 domain-containing protein [Microbulbifer echini]|uniref:UPF0391 membrane protein ACCI51_08895 n=1 Tax=Microbulbifer echini TaxID=1529067 RepID=A0ABV4NN85_9GAMM